MRKGLSIWEGDTGMTELGRLHAQLEGCKYLVNGTTLGDVFAVSCGKEMVLGDGRVHALFVFVNVIAAASNTHCTSASCTYKLWSRSLCDQHAT
jgi:hypothetical protein